MAENEPTAAAETRANAVAKLRRAASLPRMKDGRRPPMHGEAGGFSEGERNQQAEEKKDEEEKKEEEERKENFRRVRRALEKHEHNYNHASDSEYSSSVS